MSNRSLVSSILKFIQYLKYYIILTYQRILVNTSILINRVGILNVAVRYFALLGWLFFDHMNGGRLEYPDEASLNDLDHAHMRLRECQVTFVPCWREPGQ